MLSDLNPDLLALSFDAGLNRYLNMRLDVSSIDLSCCGGTFVGPGDVPVFRFTLYDNPGGGQGLGGGTVLDTLDASGTASAQSTFEWTEVLLPMDALGNTDGNVILQIDLLQGGYAALDNFRVAASDIPGDVGIVPEPAAVGGWSAALIVGLALLRERRRRSA